MKPIAKKKVYLLRIESTGINGPPQDAINPLHGSLHWLFMMLNVLVDFNYWIGGLVMTIKMVEWKC